MCKGLVAVAPKGGLQPLNTQEGCQPNRLTGGLCREKWNNIQHFWRICNISQQPLRQKSKIFATSPYTGEALGASVFVHSRVFRQTEARPSGRAFLYFRRKSVPFFLRPDRGAWGIVKGNGVARGSARNPLDSVSFGTFLAETRKVRTICTFHAQKARPFGRAFQYSLTTAFTRPMISASRPSMGS